MSRNEPGPCQNKKPDPISLGLIHIKLSVGELAAWANVPVLDRSGVLLVARDHCLALISQCENSEVLILGIEGFTLNGASIQPEMDLIADFSSLLPLDRLHASRQSCDCARTFFEQVPNASDKMFSFELVRASLAPTPDS